MSFAVEFIQADQTRRVTRSRLLRLVFRIIGLVTLGGAMWIILWIDNRPTGRMESGNGACDRVHCDCASRAAQAARAGRP